MKNKYSRVVLDNGLTLLVSPMESTRILSIDIFIRGGSRNETKANNGISHFIEHVLFKGTKKRHDAFTISKEIDELGGDFNGLTGQEYSCFYIRLLDEHFENAIDILSDILLNSSFNEPDIEIERKTILEEIKMRKDSPESYIWEIYNNLLYNSYPLGYPISGEEKTLTALSKNSLIAYWKKNFTASNYVVSIAGNVGIEKTVRIINKYFAGLQKGRIINSLPVKEKQAEPAVSLYYKKTEQTNLCLGTRAFSYNDPDFIALDVLNIILGANTSSRLFTILREQKGLAYSVSTGTDLFSDTGNFSVNAGVAHKNVETAIKIIFDEFNRLKKEEVLKEELDKVKNCITGYIYMAIDSSTGVANYLGRQELHLKKIVLPEQRVEMIKKITPEDIQRVANRIFIKNNLNLALIGPQKNKSSFHKLLNNFD